MSGEQLGAAVGSPVQSQAHVWDGPHGEGYPAWVSGHCFWEALPLRSPSSLSCTELTWRVPHRARPGLGGRVGLFVMGAGAG